MFKLRPWDHPSKFGDISGCAAANATTIADNANDTTSTDNAVTTTITATVTTTITATVSAINAYE
jgi:hypothetical protein